MVHGRHHIVLDELDKELEKRGLHFVRFADDCVIYVKGKRAGDRVMKSVSRFISRKLKLKVNETKSSVTRSRATRSTSDLDSPSARPTRESVSTPRA